MSLLDYLKRKEPKKKGFGHTFYDAFFTFLYKPNFTNPAQGSVHIRDGMDLKRTMIMVVIAMGLCYLSGAYNIGYQHFLAIGKHTGVMDAIHLKLIYGLVQIIPILVVSFGVGLGIEFYFSSRRGHPVEEGYLVSGALIPLIMPPDIPLWMLALSVAFAVVLGKEAFGGTGMNVVNIALLARAFVFFAYPTEISGDGPWIAGLDKSPDPTVETMYASYGWTLTNLFNPLFGALGWTTYEAGLPTIQGFSGATPLALGYLEGWSKTTDGQVTGGVIHTYSSMQMFWGGIPGCIGETSKPFIILGGIILLATRVASWRIMLSMTLGIVMMGLIFNAWLANPFMSVPWYEHFSMGGLLFAMVFMATDPVTAAGTNRGKFIYGFSIGVLGMVIRVMNPAYAEGWMLAILTLNVFAPLIDYFVVDGNISKRLKRAKHAK